MGSNEGRAWVSLGGVGHLELSEGSLYGRWTSQDFLRRGGASEAGAWWILVFVLIWFPLMGEIQIMCDMYMDEAGIPMLTTMSNE